MQHQVFSHKLLPKEKNLNVLLRPFYSVLLFFFVILNFINMRTKNLYGKNNKSNGVGVVRMYVTTCVTNKLQMNTVHLQQFLPNLRNWTSDYSRENCPLRNAWKFGRNCDSQISNETSITLNMVPAQNYSQFAWRSTRESSIRLTLVNSFNSHEYGKN